MIPPKGSIPPNIRNRNSLDYRVNQRYNSQYVSDYSPRTVNQEDKKKDIRNLRLHLRDELQRKLSLLEEDIRLCEQEGLMTEKLTIEAVLSHYWLSFLGCCLSAVI